MLARSRFTLFTGTIDATGVYAKTGTVADEGYKTIPFLDNDLSGIAFLATITNWSGDPSPICDVRIVHTPDGTNYFQLGALPNITGNSVKLLLPESLVTDFVFNRLGVHVAKLENVTSFDLEVVALCAQA